jgi:phosphate transport system substrate-binding protein
VNFKRRALTRAGSIAAIAIAGTMLLSSCAANEAPAAAPSGAASATTTPVSGTLNGSGSSAQANAETAWVAAFQQTNPNATVNYASIGSGAGVTSFIAGGVQFAGSDAALTDAQLAGTFTGCAAGSKGIDLPVYIAPIAVAFNLKGVKTLNLDATTIANIFSGKIKTWDDAAIKADNPGVTLPSTAITPVHRSDSSGTTNNFTDYLAKAAPAAWPNPANNVFPYPGEAGAQNAGVASAAEAADGSIAYLEASNVGTLSVAKLKVGSNYVAYSPKAAAAVVDASKLVTAREKNDLAYSIDRTTTAAGAYPLVLVSYFIACQNYTDPAVGTLVKAYASYVASSAGQQAAAKAVNSAPLSASVAKMVATAIATIK